MERSDELYEINNQLDNLRTLFYGLLSYPKDSYSEEKDCARRELRFALNDLLNKIDYL